MSTTDTTLEKFDAVIAVAAIVPPAGRAKSYTVQTHDGGAFSIWPEKAGLLRVGEQYQIQYTEKQTDNGTVYRNVQGTPRHLGPFRAPKQDNTPLQPATTTTIASNKKMDYWQPKPRDPAEQKQIWVCAMLCREIEKANGYMTEDMLIKRGETHAHVWDALFGVREIAAD